MRAGSGRRIGNGRNSATGETRRGVEPCCLLEGLGAGTRGSRRGDGARPRANLRGGYSVFNVAQVEGYEVPTVTKRSEPEKIQTAEAFFGALGADIRHGGNRACYRPLHDDIQMPPFEAFRDVIAYYSTLAHEATHWTGAKARLDRDLSGRFGTNAYAAEELVAESGQPSSVPTSGSASSRGPTTRPTSRHGSRCSGRIRGPSSPRHRRPSRRRTICTGGRPRGPRLEERGLGQGLPRNSDCLAGSRSLPCGRRLSRKDAGASSMTLASCSTDLAGRGSEGQGLALSLFITPRYPRRGCRFGNAGTTTFQRSCVFSLSALPAGDSSHVHGSVNHGALSYKGNSKLWAKARASDRLRIARHICTPSSSSPFKAKACGGFP